MTTTAAPFIAALEAANLPDWLTWRVEIRPRRKTLGMSTGADGTVIEVPPGADPARVVVGVQANLGRLVRHVRQAKEQAPEYARKELVNGAGFAWLGHNHRLQLVDDSDTTRVCGCQCRRPITRHPGVPIIAEPGHPTWSSGRTSQLTLRRDAATAATIIDWYRTEGQAWVDARLPELVNRMQVPAGFKVQVRTFDRRSPRTWGTYRPATHTAWLHWSIFQLGPRLVEGVLTHEAAHAALLGRGGHGPRWQSVMSRVMFDHEDRRTRLNAEGRFIWMGDLSERQTS